jgi:ABC-2 type transport system ATP-binding protein
MLEVVNLKKTFDGSKYVLNNVSLDVKNNEIYGLVGLNGIGKTTLIKNIICLMQPNSGSIKINGIENKHESAKKMFFYLPEKFQPSQYLKGREFLEIFLSFFDCKIEDEVIKNMCATVGLDYSALDRLTIKYSKGMGQKLGLISAFMSKAKLLILDEPMSGLDPQARIGVKKMMLEYKKNGGSIFFSSHILSDIDEICDTIGVIHNGKMIFDGKSDQFKSVSGENDLEKAFLKAIS